MEWETGLYKTQMRVLRFKKLEVSWHFLSVVPTGQSRESSSGTTATLLRLCPCVRRDSCPVRPDWLTCSVTQQSSRFLPAAFRDSHNPPGKSPLNLSMNTALIWKLFRRKHKDETREGQEMDTTVFCFFFIYIYSFHCYKWLLNKWTLLHNDKWVLYCCTVQLDQFSTPCGVQVYSMTMWHNWCSYW